MDTPYMVGFKDVYPWVWSVMLGVSLTLADRRGAFQAKGARTTQRLWVKNIVAMVLNLALPGVIFGLTMTRLGPLYSQNMDFWQIVGSLYLACVPMGAHHAWRFVAERFRWGDLTDGEARTVKISRVDHLVWILVALAIPTLAVLIKWRVPF